LLNAEQILQAALVLPESARASLASDLLASLADLPLAEDDAEETYQEVLRRDAEMDEDPAAGITLEQFRDEVHQARRA
jgi:putative addiction module component (TIGR02574 family)